jgi:hypothetical protein
MILDYIISASDSTTDTSVAHITTPGTTHTPGLVDIPGAIPVFIGMVLAIVILTIAVTILTWSRFLLKEELKKIKER